MQVLGVITGVLFNSASQVWSQRTLGKIRNTVTAAVPGNANQAGALENVATRVPGGVEDTVVCMPAGSATRVISAH